MFQTEKLAGAEFLQEGQRGGENVMCGEERGQVGEGGAGAK